MVCGTRALTRRSMTGLRRRSGERQVQRKENSSGNGTDAHAPAVHRTQKKIYFVPFHHCYRVIFLIFLRVSLLIINIYCHSTSLSVCHLEPPFITMLENKDTYLHTCPQSLALDSFHAKTNKILKTQVRKDFFNSCFI